MSDWMVVVSLLLLGGIVGVVVTQLVKFSRTGGKLSITLDDRPVSRLILASIVIVFVLVIIRLITIDVDTRDCIDQLHRDQADECY